MVFAYALPILHQMSQQTHKERTRNACHSVLQQNRARNFGHFRTFSDVFGEFSANFRRTAFPTSCIGTRKQSKMNTICDWEESPKASPPSVFGRKRRELNCPPNQWEKARCVLRDGQKCKMPIRRFGAESAPACASMPNKRTIFPYFADESLRFRNRIGLMCE